MRNEGNRTKNKVNNAYIFTRDPQSLSSLRARWDHDPVIPKVKMKAMVSIVIGR